MSLLKECMLAFLNQSSIPVFGICFFNSASPARRHPLDGRQRVGRARRGAANAQPAVHERGPPYSGRHCGSCYLPLNHPAHLLRCWQCVSTHFSDLKFKSGSLDSSMCAE